MPCISHSAQGLWEDLAPGPSELSPPRLTKEVKRKGRLSFHVQPHAGAHSCADVSMKMQGDTLLLMPLGMSSAPTSHKLPVHMITNLRPWLARRSAYCLTNLSRGLPASLFACTKMKAAAHCDIHTPFPALALPLRSRLSVTGPLFLSSLASPLCSGADPLLNWKQLSLFSCQPSPQ